ncbi:DNA-binding protein [Mycolicibacterium diernhoferi]|uniref:DNA-binding protein n=1 Tax=Mycolicibacterium diernhoferi TaxID=1801 RepID=A0A1T3WMD9_9MYCO|nr:hypothetical protein [Mycolicibacterium diernhoferi]OPE55556.1 hypothetical protein BV510_04510 [Mycolicibacterium diernhoferi]PEG52084.1 DNA-binding protein [Mycolicibacterium diernhoferi]
MKESLAQPAEVACYLRTTAAALAQMRWRGTGPAFIRIGRRVLYRWDDVESFLVEHRCKEGERREGNR